MAAVGGGESGGGAEGCGGAEGVAEACEDAGAESRGSRVADQVVWGREGRGGEILRGVRGLRIRSPAQRSADSAVVPDVEVTQTSWSALSRGQAGGLRYNPAAITRRASASVTIVALL